MVAMNLNTNTYALSVGASSVSRQLFPQDQQQMSLIIYNSGTSPVFLVSNSGSAATAVFPTSTGLPGKVIPPGAIVTYIKDINDDYLSAIATGGTNVLYIAVGAGE